MNLLDEIQFVNGYHDDNFVGLRYEKDKIIINLPLGYDINRKNENEELTEIEKKTRILLLLKSISLIKALDTTTASFGNSDGRNREIPFNSFFWLIEDYLNNGFYQEIEKKYIQNSHGKINWKKTLNSEHYFSDDNVVFVNPYYESNIQNDNVITELNNYCVKKSCEYISFLFGNIILPEITIDDDKMKTNKKLYLNIINKELSKTFNDRKKMLLANMKRVISFTFDEDIENQPNYGTYRYEYVWEKMVNDTLGTKSLNINDYFPEAYWNIINSEKEKDKSRLRPDTILRDSLNNCIYILDAKYYKYGITSNIQDLPHTDSIQKQITYGDHIANNFDIYNIKENDIYNAFILPYNKCNNNFGKKKDIEYMGFAESDWRKDNNVVLNYEKVSLILIDTKYLIDCYYKKEKEDLVRLMSLISNN